SRSLDRGSSWQEADSDVWITSITDLVPSVGIPGGLQAFSSPTTLFELGGGAWTVIPTNLCCVPYSRLTPAPSRPGRLFLIGDAALFGCGHLPRSDDGGRNWVEVHPPDCVNSMAVSPNDPDLVFTGGFFSSASYRSQDGGRSWTPILPA